MVPLLFSSIQRFGCGYIWLHNTKCTQTLNPYSHISLNWSVGIWNKIFDQNQLCCIESGNGSQGKFTLNKLHHSHVCLSAYLSRKKLEPIGLIRMVRMRDNSTSCGDSVSQSWFKPFPYSALLFLMFVNCSRQLSSKTVATFGNLRKTSSADLLPLFTRGR